MTTLQPVRGTHDLLPEDMRRHRAVGDVARETAALYGYDEMATPIFEFSEVFSRTLGEATDIVTKEMYSFSVSEGEEITLRPENTAGVARAVISNGLTQQLPLKYFYNGPMFRHERPQKGRQRQFHQIGVELFGVAEPEGDVEIILLGAHILERLGLLDRIRLEINTLGDPESRKAYRAALVEYFERHRGDLSAESHDRLTRNPLRILDSKDRGDQQLVAGAPSFSDYLTEESHAFFEAVKRGLERQGLAHQLNPRLVRGLDYYCHTAFEFKTDELGAQDTVMAGGRYDHLVEMMGGNPVHGVGWAAGIERLALMLTSAPEVPRPLVVVPVGDAQSDKAHALVQALRRSGWRAEIGFSGNVKKRMRRADRLAARAVLLLGEEESEKGGVTLRDLDSGEQDFVAESDLPARLKRFI